MRKLINNLKIYFWVVFFSVSIIGEGNAETRFYEKEGPVASAKEPADTLSSPEDSRDVLLTEAEQQWLAQHPVIRLASNQYWPPLEYFEKDGGYQGIASDFIALIEKKLNIHFVRSPVQSWSESILGVRERKLDVLSMAMDTPARREFAQFTQPYISNTMVIVTGQSTEFVPGVAGLSGKKVSVVEGYASSETLSMDYPDIILQAYPTIEAALSAVTKGEVFAFVGNIITTSYVMQDKGLTHLRVSGEVPYHFELGLGVRSDWPELAVILDKTLASISDRERADIFSRWVHVDVHQDIPWGATISLVSGLVCFIFGVLCWNRLLKKKVKERTALLELMALQDPLTGLPNRISMRKTLEQRIYAAERVKGAVFAVMFVDLDEFKKVNDSFGHSVGDKLLIAVANRLKSTLRRSDYVSRFGGDEFVVITQIVRSKDAIETLCTHLLKAMQYPYTLGKQKIITNMSIGAACYPDDGMTVEALLYNADKAMYTAKSKGRNCFILYSPDLQALEGRIKSRAENDEHHEYAGVEGAPCYADASVPPKET
ncbi:hypothetical protein DI392_06550 [Vibrio albus]|uniref:GGDEF domain-containing protein n=1 Tax=Vibrio albus TaxID=2200953 RepID=A0A2U3BAN4_9VIBR|nr:diguanylate cyclase [Vibrio albus]PWI33856.1 hypothetical protein DI392_06550 [Vibrio albus]